jgi:probable F420-dependent oxidoreductase
MRPFRFGLQSATSLSMPAWRERARMAEGLGYSTLYVPDHLDDQFAPLIAMTVAAETTSTLSVGSLVLDNDFRHPVVLAKEIATLGLAAEGRVELGLGAGWLRSDYDTSGIDFDPGSVRVDRLAESLTIMQALWTEGEATFSGTHYTVRGAQCDPRPTTPPRTIVGGGSKRVLTLAAQAADTVGMNWFVNLSSGEYGGATALTATLDQYDRCLGWVRQAAGDRFESIELQVIAFTVMVVPSQKAAARSVRLLGLPGEEVLDLPMVLVGTVENICDRLLERRERWGFSNIVVPDDAVETFAPVVARLAGA